MVLRTQNLSCGYDGKTLIRGIDLTIESGNFICLLGPNGVGKTTLFKTLLGFIRPIHGDVYLGDRKIHQVSPVTRAQNIGYVPQACEMFFPYTVFDVVMMGRSPRIETHRAPSLIDVRITEKALRMLSVGHLKHRVFTKLSSGERQLVLIARAIAQESKFLILDEPMSNLDFGNQACVLSEIRSLSAQGIGIIMTTHHPNHVFESGGKVVLIDRDRRVHTGEAGDVMTEINMKAAYGIDVTITSFRSEQDKPIRYCIPVRHRRKEK